MNFDIMWERGELTGPKWIAKVHPPVVDDQEYFELHVYAPRDADQRIAVEVVYFADLADMPNVVNRKWFVTGSEFMAQARAVRMLMATLDSDQWLAVGAGPQTVFGLYEDEYQTIFEPSIDGPDPAV